jgi:putative transposase
VAIRRDESARYRGFDLPGRRNLLSTHSAVYNTFNICRHLTTAPTYRILREHAFDTWRVAVAAIV